VPKETPARPEIAADDEAERLFRAAKSCEAHPDRMRYVEALKAYVAYADGHRKPLEAAAATTAHHLDEAGLALYRFSEVELAARAIEAGLALAPGSSSLLHHKAMILLAQNKSLDQVLPLLDTALQSNPHDKQIWATKGDALKLLDRPEEAAEAYLHAQQLDATSMQYVERALKVSPENPVALRMKLQLSRVHGGDRQALEACEALLKTHPDDAGLLMARAELLGTLGQVDAALAALERAGVALPDNPRVELLRGRLFLATGRGPEAIAEFARLIGSAATLDVAALTEMAEAFEKAQDPGHALAARERIRQLEPRNLGNLVRLRQLATQEGKFDIGLAACETILETSPENLEALSAKAEVLAAAGRSDEALDAYRALLKTHPKAIVEGRQALALARTVGMVAAVVEFARQILSVEPNDAPAHEELARALGLLGDQEGALASFDLLLTLKPQDPTYLAEKRQILASLGRTEELAEVYDVLFKVDPTRSDLALERGHLYLARAFDVPEGSPERAEAARQALVSYERASLDPALAERSGLGLARASRLVGDHDAAIRAYQEFLGRGGNAQRGDVLKELGHALREVGRLSEAAEAYDRAVNLGLEDPDLFWGETEVLSLLNQEAKALQFTELLLQRDPSNSLFLRRKGQLLLKTGRRPEGLEVLKSAIDGAPHDPHVRFEVAEALRASGAYADAVGYFRQGLELEPTNRPGRLALAETQLLAGEPNEALPVIDALLREDPNDLAAWRGRADIYRKLQRPGDLTYSLKAILLLDPHNSGALLEKFRLHLDSGERPAAHEALSMLLDSGGPEANDPGLLLQLGDLSAELGQVEEANRSYERAAQADPSLLAEIAARRARLRLSAGRPDLALEVLDETLKTLPGAGSANPSALMLRAEILTNLERPAEALAVYEEVLKREPKSPVALAGIGRALLDQGKHGEARDFLKERLLQVAPSAGLTLLLAEALAGTGALPEAVAAVRTATGQLPKVAALWIRLGELQIAREAWTDAAGAYAHAIALDAEDPALHLRAGFVAERLGHPNEALALYDRATQIAPGDKNAWCSRGLALLGTGRPDEALVSFDRALALDSDFDAAKEGKKAAVQKTREGQVERFGREALLLEAKLRRNVTKNDLFVSLHVPFELLEPVLLAISRNPRIDLDRLSEIEMRDLENHSYHLISTALERRPEGIERRGFTLADVATLCPPNATLDQIQRLFGYLKTVLEADLRPENLRLAPDVEELARKALLLPENQRTLFQLVRSLRVGIFKARLIKLVETSGTTAHASLPGLDLGQYSPEFRSRGAGVAARGTVGDGTQYFEPENIPAPIEPPDATSPPAAGGRGHGHSGSHPAAGAAVRCVGCGGIASVVHSCGAPLCQHCLAQFPLCPKCGRAISPESSHLLGGAATPTESVSHAATRHPSAEGARAHPGKGLVAAAPPKGRPTPTRPATSKGPPVERAPADVAPKVPPPATAPGAEAPPPRPVRPREKADDEPRL
jgi:tetratricopeptide (TPR) repeat protein